MDIDNIINSLFGSSEGIWAAIKKFAKLGSREATRMMLQMYYCLKSPKTSTLDRLIIVGGLCYQLIPNDALSVKKYKMLGLLDNGVSLAIAYNKVQSNITPEITNQVNAILEQWFPSDEITDPLEQVVPEPPTFPEVISESDKDTFDNEDDIVID